MAHLHAAHATDYWMAWPDHYARGGGLGNQLEQMLGRVQCAGNECKDHGAARFTGGPVFDARRRAAPRL